MKISPVELFLPAEKYLDVESSAHNRYRTTNYFASLNGLRALAIVAVIWHHTVGQIPGMSFFSNGLHGVTLFFSISGFLITTLILREKEISGDVNLKNFYIRRSLRIFPLYYGVLFLYSILVFFVERNSLIGSEFFGNFGSFFTYTSNWFVPLSPDGRVIFYFAWSLAAEEQFYLFWPTVEKYVKNRGPFFIMILLVLALAGAQLLDKLPANSSGFSFGKIVASLQLSICLGVVLAHLLHGKRSYSAFKWIFGWRFSSIVSMFFVGLVLSRFTGIPLLVDLSMLLLVGSCVYREDHCLAQILRLKPVAYIGMVSYGMYLFHMLSKNVVTKLVSKAGFVDVDIFVFFATVLISITVAGLSYRHVESYFMSLKKRLS